jgi:lipopolysaccharide export system permease protein
VLIGTIYAMARLAQSSEFTILRTAGLGPERALILLLGLGLLLGALTFIIGEYVAPSANSAPANCAPSSGAPASGPPRPGPG